MDEEWRKRELPGGESEISGEASEECRVALQVAMKVIGERCGSTIADGRGERVRQPFEVIPKEVLDIAQGKSLNRDKKIKKIKDTWGIAYAKDFVRDIVGIEPGTDIYDNAVNQMATKVAEEIVDTGNMSL